MTTKETKPNDHATPETASGSGTPETASSTTPNIKFTGRNVMDRGKRKILKEANPIESFSNGGTIVELPPADFQKRVRLFYHEAAAEIAALFPQSYKLLKRK